MEAEKAAEPRQLIIELANKRDNRVSEVAVSGEPMCSATAPSKNDVASGPGGQSAQIHQIDGGGKPMRQLQYNTPSSS